LIQHFYAQLFQSFFCTQLVATWEWPPAQPEQLRATYEWYNQHNFHTKKHNEILFKKQAAFLSFP
jgi:hypothetical protein